jgi:hypothetical protein
MIAVATLIALIAIGLGEFIRTEEKISSKRHAV